jgi:ligand-binding SRPBCC domain-containing protein
MPHYTITIDIPRPLAEMFAFFTAPRNLTQFTPPDLSLQLLTAPETIAVGARLVWQARRWGVSQKIIQEVACIEPEKLIVVEQKQGPLARWIQTHHFESSSTGMRILENIDFEPPAGLLGRLISAKAILGDLEKISVYRAMRLRELFSAT